MRMKYGSMLEPFTDVRFNSWHRIVRWAIPNAFTFTSSFLAPTCISDRNSRSHAFECYQLCLWILRLATRREILAKCSDRDTRGKLDVSFLHPILVHRTLLRTPSQ
jgi:hypothetical protein